MRNVVYLSDRSDNGLENGEFAVALPRLEEELSRHPDHDDDRPWIEQVTDAINAANALRAIDVVFDVVLKCSEMDRPRYSEVPEAAEDDA